MSAATEGLRVGVLGVGAMGSALVKGWLQAGLLQPQQIRAYDVATKHLGTVCEQLGIRAAESEADAAMEADLLLVAVKPYDVQQALESAFANVPDGPPLVLSIAAGVPLAKLEAAAPGRAVIRVMPNTPALVLAAASAYARGTDATDADAELAGTLLGAVGRALEVPEKLLNAVTGLSGSGPAYVYLAIEALADGGVRCGLPRAAAIELAAQTVLGAAQMVIETGEHPGVLKDRVTSPGGTTIAGLAELERNGFRSALIEAVTAATKRADELG